MTDRLKCLTERCDAITHPPAGPDLVAVDFETYYDKEVDIKSLGMYQYIAHPKCDAYLVAIYADEGKLTYVGPLETAPWEAINGRPWWAHNAAFDAHVFEEARRRGKIPAHIEPISWDCTADMSVYMKAPRNLAGAARELLGAVLEKETRDLMKGKTYEDAKALGLLEQLHTYALNGDARHCYLLAQRFGAQWPDCEILISRLNRKAGSAGPCVDVPMVQGAIDSLAHVVWVAGNDIPWEWDPDKTPLSLPKAREQCRIDGVPAPTSFAEDSEAFDTWANGVSEKEPVSKADRYPWIRALSHWRKANMMMKKFKRVDMRTRLDDTFPYLVKYCGAHSGRFSGSDGFNMQNLSREPMDLTKMMEDAAPGLPRTVHIRNVFLPRKGQRMAIVDLSQIEARVLLYVAGDRKQLNLIASGMDVYEAHARATLGYTGAKPLAEMAKSDPAFKTMRQFAKARVLGLGYGCGPAKFKVVAKAMAGLDLTPEQCATTVSDFRENNPMICHLWGHMHSLLKAAAMRQEHLHLALTSGRKLAYFNPHFELNDIKAQVERGGTFYKFYGGKLVENCLKKNTKVFTNSGWKPIEDIALTDKVHDGLDFVPHGGVVFKSYQPCVEVDGVGMTADHEVLTDEGWKPALEKPRPYRPSIRELDGDTRYGQQRKEDALGVSLPLRETRSEDRSGCDEGDKAWRNTELRVPYANADREGQYDTRHVEASGICRVEEHAGPVPTSDASSVEELRRSRNNSVPSVAGEFPELLDRYGADVQNGVDAGSYGQPVGVLAGELQVGELGSECKEQADNEAPGVGVGSCQAARSEEHDVLQQATPGGAVVGGGDTASELCQPVYDILNCGPRHRFVVQGNNGPFIVHNCIQAIARDFFIHGLLEAEKQGAGELLFHVHDEGVWSVDNDDQLEVLLACMKKSPPWAPDFPLGAEGSLETFYCK